MKPTAIERRRVFIWLSYRSPFAIRRARIAYIKASAVQVAGRFHADDIRKRRRDCGGVDRQNPRLGLRIVPPEDDRHCRVVAIGAGVAHEELRGCGRRCCHAGFISHNDIARTARHDA